MRRRRTETATTTAAAARPRMTDVGVDEVMGVVVEADVRRVAGNGTPAAASPATPAAFVVTGAVVLRRRLGLCNRERGGQKENKKRLIVIIVIVTLPLPFHVKVMLFQMEIS